MTRLVRMTPSEFIDFLAHDIRTLAEENVRAGYWDETGAQERSRREHKTLLHDGLATRNHYFYAIRDDEGMSVGIIWMKVDLTSQNRPSAFIFAFEINEPYRRKGYAEQAMLELEKIAAGLGLKYLSL